MARSQPWIIDPISYTGLAYYDVSLIRGLDRVGVSAVLVGANGGVLSETRETVPVLPLFRGTATGTRVRRGINYLVSLIRLITAAARSRPAVAHWQYLQLLPLDLAAMLVMKALRIPLVYTAHETVPWRSQGRLARWLLGVMYRRVDTVIVHNEADGLVLREQFGIDQRQTRVVQHGDYALFADPTLDQGLARSQLGLPQSAPIALFFGTLRASKGLDILAAAWPRVIEVVPDALLVVAGQPDRDLDRQTLVALARLAKEPPTCGSVTLRLGKVADADINAYYRAADVLVLPYHAITTSGVLRYAYSSARAVVATAVGEHVKWVIPGVTGELVASGDASALARALAHLLSNRRRCYELGIEALRFARMHFDWTHIAAETAALYSELETLGTKSSSRAKRKTQQRRDR